jgi:serine/threonine protein kinase
MGEVYRAFDERLRREVALKLIARRLTSETDAVDRFIREALAVSALNHPNIVTIHEAGEIDEGRFIAMEFVQGRSLRECMRQGMTFDGAADVARQIAEALAVAHAAQIVHRDIKPDNVMVRDDGYVKVLDFGLARVTTSDEENEATLTGATRTGLVLGTVGYMSPEQARGENVTLASDVFAYGILLYEMLTGQHPFHAASPLAVLHGILSDAPVPPSRMGVEVPLALDQLTLECLQKDARLRPSAAEIASRLRGNEPSSAHVALSSAGGRPPTPPRLVGREAEVEVLNDAYWQAAGGRGLVVAVAGEPGLGKTALVENCLNCLAASGQARIARGRCSERLAGSEAYLPFLEALDGNADPKSARRDGGEVVPRRRSAPPGRTAECARAPRASTGVVRPRVPPRTRVGSRHRAGDLLHVRDVADAGPDGSRR